ncbi:MAG: hypothetical protein JO199_05610, partial [Candidatus Eremiobacteraeota bacterium]|nr:hypothetical protein [Candidatus Eremiobacteraeota bacterium]
MRASRLSFAILCLLALAAPVAAAQPPPGYTYLAASHLDLVDLLPPPPDPSSPTEMADERQVAQIVAHRTPEQMDEARDESKRTVFFYAPAVGPNFTAANFPKVDRFFKRAEADVEKLVDEVKQYWQ